MAIYAHNTPDVMNKHNSEQKTVAVGKGKVVETQAKPDQDNGRTSKHTHVTLQAADKIAIVSCVY